LRFWFHLNLSRRIWVSGFGGFRGSSEFNGICHMCIYLSAYIYAHIHIYILDLTPLEYTHIYTWQSTTSKPPRKRAKRAKYTCQNMTKLIHMYLCLNKHIHTWQSTTSKTPRNGPKYTHPRACILIHTYTHLVLNDITNPKKKDKKGTVYMYI